MSKIEKMMQNAGVEKSKCWDDCTTCTRTSCDKNISYIKSDYPPFTAEKQLELIKWLASSRKGILISNLSEDEYSISTGFYYCAKNINNFKNNKDLGIVIAIFINDLWQDLTEQERTEIRSILK